MEIQEIIRRWQAGGSLRQIAAGTGLSRDTVTRYVAAARAEGIVQDGPVATEEQLSRLAAMGQVGPRQVEMPSQDLLEPWADQIYQWLTGDRLLLTRIHELLLVRGCAVSYSSLRRFIVKRNWGRRSVRTVRMADTEPGEVAEVDFGRLGMITDPATGKRRVVWALIIVLSYSRHCFVWPTHSQKLEDVIAGLEATWTFFGGVPSYLVIDNFPAAVAGPDPLHPRLTRGFLEIFPAPRLRRRPGPSAPSQGQAQGGAQRFLRPGASLQGRRFPWAGPPAQRSPALAPGGGWPAGHGATRRQPLLVFQDEERHALLPWDGEPYEITHWRTAKVHPDHHVACQYALYSVPSSSCPPGQRVEIRLDSKLARIYHRGKLLKIHQRQPRGGRSTDPPVHRP